MVLKISLALRICTAHHCPPKPQWIDSVDTIKLGMGSDEDPNISLTNQKTSGSIVTGNPEFQVGSWMACRALDHFSMKRWMKRIGFEDFKLAFCDLLNLMRQLIEHRFERRIRTDFTRAILQLTLFRIVQQHFE